MKGNDMYKIMTDDLVYSYYVTKEIAEKEMEILKTLTQNEITKAKDTITENEEFLDSLSLVNGSLVDEEYGKNKNYSSHYSYVPKTSNINK